MEFIKASPSVRQSEDHPPAWLVFTPDGYELDYLVFTDRQDAEGKAMEFAVEHHADQEWSIHPLYAGTPVTAR